MPWTGVSKSLSQRGRSDACAVLATDDFKGTTHAAERSMQNCKLATDLSSVVHRIARRCERRQQYGKECCQRSEGRLRQE